MTQKSLNHLHLNSIVRDSLILSKCHSSLAYQSGNTSKFKYAKGLTQEPLQTSIQHFVLYGFTYIYIYTYIKVYLYIHLTQFRKVTFSFLMKLGLPETEIILKIILMKLTLMPLSAIELCIGRAD